MSSENPSFAQDIGPAPAGLHRVKIYLWLWLALSIVVSIAHFFVGYPDNSLGRDLKLIAGEFDTAGFKLLGLFFLVAWFGILILLASQATKGKNWTRILLVVILGYTLATNILFGGIIFAFALGLVNGLAMVIGLILCALCIVELLRGETRNYFRKIRLIRDQQLLQRLP